MGARAAQGRAARAIDGAGVLAVERLDIPRPAGRILQIDVRQSFPTPADANDLASDFSCPVNYRFNDRIQPRNVASSRENTNALGCHEKYSLEVGGRVRV